MKSSMLVSATIVVPLIAGCGRKERVPETRDRVNVRAPFVDVRVGEQGGVHVDAPFTNVETPRYQVNK